MKKWIDGGWEERYLAEVAAASLAESVVGNDPQLTDEMVMTLKKAVENFIDIRAGGFRSE